MNFLLYIFFFTCQADGHAKLGKLERGKTGGRYRVEEGLNREEVMRWGAGGEEGTRNQLREEGGAGREQLASAYGQGCSLSQSVIWIYREDGNNTSGLRQDLSLRLLLMPAIR